MLHDASFKDLLNFEGRLPDADYKLSALRLAS
jgi:hypothetical protein